MLLQISEGLAPVNLNQGIDLSIPMANGDHNPNAFGIPHPVFEPIVVGSFVGSVKAGSSANCENLLINAHGNGTHTECVGHITLERITLSECFRHFFSLAKLITVTPEQFGETDKVVALNSLLHQLTWPEINLPKALIIRTLPNDEAKRTQAWSGKNPPYLEPRLCAKLAHMGIMHLLIDLPSVDREHDEGKMLAHKAFWQFEDNRFPEPRKNATITEMIFVPTHVEDGTYLLNLQTANLQTDASPSRPVIWKLM